MLIYEKLEDFIEAFKTSGERQVFLTARRRLSEDNMLSGDVVIYFFSHYWRMYSYSEDIPSVRICPDDLLNVIGVYAGEGVVEKIQKNIELETHEFDDVLKKNLEKAKEMFSKLDCEKIVSGYIEK